MHPPERPNEPAAEARHHPVGRRHRCRRAHVTFAAAALPAFDFAEPFFVALVARPLSGYDAAAELPSENFAVTAGGGKVTIAADFSPFFGRFRAAGYSLKISQSGRVRTLCHGTITMVGE